MVGRITRLSAIVPARFGAHVCTRHRSFGTAGSCIYPSEEGLAHRWFVLALHRASQYGGPVATHRLHPIPSTATIRTMNAIPRVDAGESGREPTVMGPSSRDGASCITFSNVMVYPRARELRVNGELVEINSCAFEILLMLIEADGRIVLKKELFRRLWPNTCVGDANLRVHMYKLRKALGEDAKVIKTAPNRGYWLTAPLTVSTDPGMVCPPARQDRGTPETLEQEPHGTSVIVIDDDEETRAALNALLQSLRRKMKKQPPLRKFAGASLRLHSDHIVLNLRLER